MDFKENLNSLKILFVCCYQQQISHAKEKKNNYFNYSVYFIGRI